MVGANAGLASPTSAGYFAGNGRATPGNRFGERLGQVKVAPNAFVVGTTEAEHGLGVINVDHVLEMSARKNIARRIVVEVRRQRL